MADFPAGRDYTISYSDGENKCSYVQKACSAYDASQRGRVEKRLFLIVVENYRMFTERGVVIRDGVVQAVEVAPFHLYDLAFLIQKAFEVLSATEDWALQTEFEDAQVAADMEGVQFEHPLRDVQDRSGFAAGAAYRSWFHKNRLLLGLYQGLEEGGEFQVQGGLFAVDEDFVCNWENAIQPERVLQEPHGYWSFQIGEGWVLDGYGQDD